MNVASLPSERAAILAVIDPEAQAATSAVVSAWTAMNLFHNVMAIIMIGDMSSSSATVDASITQASDTSGTGAKAITGKSITQVAWTTAADKQKQYIINLNAEELDVDNSFDCIRLEMTPASTSGVVDCAGLILGFDPVYAPASDNDLAAVAEIIS